VAVPWLAGRQAGFGEPEGGAGALDSTPANRYQPRESAPATAFHADAQTTNSINICQRRVAEACHTSVDRCGSPGRSEGGVAGVLRSQSFRDAQASVARAAPHLGLCR